MVRRRTEKRSNSRQIALGATMKTTIALIITAVIGICIFTGCLGTAATLVLGGIQSHPILKS